MELEQRELAYRLADTQQMTKFILSIVFLISQLVSGGGSGGNHSTGGGGGGGGSTPGTVVLEGATYPLVAHPRIWVNGTTGDQTLLLSNTSTGLPQSGNIYYTHLKSNWDFLNLNTGHAYGFNCDPVTGFLCLSSMATTGVGVRNGAHPMMAGTMAALLWYASGSSPTDTTYLPTAKWAINHIEDFTSGFGCDEALSYCGRDQIMDYGRIYMPEDIALTYTLIYSTLSPTEIKLYNDKIWNGRAVSNNGLGGTATDTTKACVNQGVSDGTGNLTISNTAATFSSPILDSTWVGAYLYGMNPYDDENANYGRIATVTDSTHAVLSRNEPTQSANAHWRYSKTWKQDVGTGVGNCGLSDWFFHNRDNFPWMSMVMPEDSWQISYPPDASSSAASYNFDSGYGPWTSGTPDSRRVSIGLNNKTWDEVNGFMSLALASADDDVRARNFASYVYDFWYKRILPVEKSIDGGSSVSGAGYTSGRVHAMSTQMAIMLCNTLGPATLPCTLAKGEYINNQLSYYLYMPKVGDVSDGNGTSINAWGGEVGADEQNYRIAACQASHFVGSNSMNPWLRYQQESRLSQGFSIWQTVEEYLWCSQWPAAVDPNTNSAPNQYLMSKTNYSDCVANPDWVATNNCMQNATYIKAVSQTGFTHDDTHLLVTGGGSVLPVTLDHANGYDPGHFQIWRGTNGQPSTDNAWLLGWDNEASIGAAIAPHSYNTLVIGDENNLSWVSDFLHVSRLTTDRWGGVNPTGPSTNDYMYMFINMNPSSATSVVFTPLWGSGSGPIDVQRQIMHTKPSGAQDYIVSYDYAHTSVGEPIESYWQFQNIALNDHTGFAYSAGSLTAHMIHSSTGAEILAKFFPVSGAGTILLTADNSDGSWSPSNGFTSRVFTCAASGGICDTGATNYEVLALFMPILSTSASLPTINQLTATATGGNATVLEIQDPTTPQVMSFARQGSLLSVEGFTSTFSGTGLYVISGLTSGSYAITVGGTPVTGSPFTVVTGDTTIRFTAGAGVVAIN